MASEKRLIDANEAYEIARGSGRHNDFARSRADLTSLEEVLEECTTVDAVEVVHGQWKNITDFGNGDCYGFCSACAAEQHAQNASALKAFHRYCRWCGAKMDGERKDNERKAD